MTRRRTGMRQRLQTIHEVEFPAELEAIEDGADLMRALSDYRLSAGKAKLVRR